MVKKRTDLKLVVMSATLEAENFNLILIIAPLMVVPFFFFFFYFVQFRIVCLKDFQECLECRVHQLVCHRSTLITP